MGGGGGGGASHTASPALPPSRVYGDDISFHKLPTLECFTEPTKEKGLSKQRFPSQSSSWIGLGMPELRSGPTPQGSKRIATLSEVQNGSVGSCDKWTAECYGWAFRDDDGQGMIAVASCSNGAVPQDGQNRNRARFKCTTLHCPATLFVIPPLGWSWPQVPKFRAFCAGSGTRVGCRGSTAT